MPLSLNHLLGAFIGRLLWVTHSSMRHVTLTNLYYCYPELTHDELRALAKKTLVETGKTITETAFVWMAPVPRVLSKVQSVNGLAPILAHQQANKPVVILTPHISCWELTSLVFAQHSPISCLYQPSRKAPKFNELVKQRRERTGATLVPTTAAGVISLIKALKKGGVVGILPDQEPGSENGIVSTFFGRDALSMTLVSKLLSRSQAAIYICQATRRPRAQGYDIHFTEISDPRVYDTSLETSVLAVNEAVEKVVRALPEQYQWGYKRFKRTNNRPKNIYDRPLEPRP